MLKGGDLPKTSSASTRTRTRPSGRTRCGGTSRAACTSPRARSLSTSARTAAGAESVARREGLGELRRRGPSTAAGRRRRAVRGVHSGRLASDRRCASGNVLSQLQPLHLRAAALCQGRRSPRLLRAFVRFCLEKAPADEPAREAKARRRRRRRGETAACLPTLSELSVWSCPTTTTRSAAAGGGGGGGGAATGAAEIIQGGDDGGAGAAGGAADIDWGSGGGGGGADGAADIDWGAGASTTA